MGQGDRNPRVRRVPAAPVATVGRTAARAPDPVSGARALLYDVGQLDAWRAGQPVPPLPDAEADLLGVRQAAGLMGV